MFERLFGSGTPGERRQNFLRRQVEQRSILDFIAEDARDMQKRLGAGDRDKLEQDLGSVREIEIRIERAERFGTTYDPAAETPVGVPSDQAEYVQLMYDMLVLAFQTDSTRVATFVLGHDGDNRSFSHIGVPEGHHDFRIIKIKPTALRRWQRSIDGMWSNSEVPAEASTDKGYRRAFTAAQLDDCLWQWQCRR